jgi:hypothetical protein
MKKSTITTTTVDTSTTNEEENNQAMETTTETTETIVIDPPTNEEEKNVNTEETTTITAATTSNELIEHIYAAGMDDKAKKAQRVNTRKQLRKGVDPSTLPIKALPTQWLTTTRTNGIKKNPTTTTTLATETQPTLPLPTDVIATVPQS